MPFLVIHEDILKSKASVQAALYKELNNDLTKLSIQTWIYWVKLCHNHNVLMSHDFFVD